jgi:FkbM family methyltransferase
MNGYWKGAMHMISTVFDRARMVAAKLNNDARLRHSSWGDVRHDVFKFYTLRKNALRRSMQVTQSGDIARVDIEGRTIYWPAAADPDRLIDMYFEVFTEGNHHYFNVPETRVAAGDVVLDCGACEGYFTLQALGSGAALVYSIEPGRAISQCLERTFARELRDGRVSINACVLGDRGGTVRFSEDRSDPTKCRILPAGDAGPTEMVRDVEMLTVDSFCERNRIAQVDYLKADVEGAEPGLLRGAGEVLRTCRPKLSIAAYHNPDDADRIISYLTDLDLGYRFRVKGIVVYDGLPRPVMVHAYTSDL